MRLRSFGMIGVAAVLVGCGGAGSGSVGTVGATGTPGGGANPPGESVPSGSNQPVGSSVPGGGSLCQTACSFLDKYPCTQTSNCTVSAGSDAGAAMPTGDCITPTNCLSECQVSLTELTPAELDCVKAALSLLQCADSHGLASCTHDGNLNTDAAAQACAQQIAAVQKLCTDTSQNCGPADTCDGCTCLNPNNPQACTDVCQTPNGGTCTMSGDQCAGCNPGCEQCLCLNNNDVTMCAAACPDAG